MEKIDYNKKMLQIISKLKHKPSLLLHSCCAPCSSAVLEKIKDFFEVTVIYYNPNIYPEEEYQKRKLEQIKLLNYLKIDFMDCDYNQNDFLNNIIGLENEKEGGARCNKCFFIRLEKTAKIAKENEFEYFGTTLTISPHKSALNINKIGEMLEELEGIKFLYSDFKKQNGYLRSIQISNELKLYRQNYCGCKFSIY